MKFLETIKARLNWGVPQAALDEAFRPTLVIPPAAETPKPVVDTTPVLRRLAVLTGDAESYAALSGADDKSFAAAREQELDDAISKNDISQIKYMLANAPDILESRDGMGATPLMRAIESGHVGVAGYLISRGANIEAQDALGNTPLMIAAAAGCLDTAKRLVKYGADVDFYSDNGLTARDMAKGNVAMTALFDEYARKGIERAIADSLKDVKKIPPPPMSLKRLAELDMEAKMTGGVSAQIERIERKTPPPLPQKFNTAVMGWPYAPEPKPQAAPFRKLSYPLEQP
ncbi:MAG: ankyrin repeat domain-containing protein [Alphaproteobacteria bacterium]|nr:ankyrin repeat domain-containing protein [Alphaproteobacteria bacterium]